MILLLHTEDGKLMSHDLNGTAEMLVLSNNELVVTVAPRSVALDSKFMVEDQSAKA